MYLFRYIGFTQKLGIAKMNVTKTMIKSREEVCTAHTSTRVICKSIEIEADPEKNYPESMSGSGSSPKYDQVFLVP